MMGSSYEMTDKVTLTFETDYVADNGRRVALIGSLPQLGAWQPKHSVLAEQQPQNSGHWKVRVVLPENTPFLWKWILISSDRGNVYRWEECENRKCSSGRSNGCWEAKWNTPANFHPLVTTGKPNTPQKKDCKVKVDNKSCDCRQKDNCKPYDGCDVKDHYKTKEDLKHKGDKKEECAVKEEDDEFTFQNSEPTNMTFMEKVRDRLCIII